MRQGGAGYAVFCCNMRRRSEVGPILAAIFGCSAYLICNLWQQVFT